MPSCSWLLMLKCILVNFAICDTVAAELVPWQRRIRRLLGWLTNPLQHGSHAALRLFSTFDFIPFDCSGLRRANRVDLVPAVGDLSYIGGHPQVLCVSQGAGWQVKVFAPWPVAACCWVSFRLVSGAERRLSSPTVARNLWENGFR